MEGTTAPPGNEGATPARVPLTRAGAERLREQATRLTTVERPALLARAQRASLFLSPSTGQAVAQVARNDLAVVNRRIAELEEVLAGADVIDPGAEPSVVEVGTRVTVRSSDGTEDTFTIVGPTEADLSQGWIASDSAAGKALLGKRPGATVTAGSGDEALVWSIVDVAQSTGLPSPVATARAGPA